MKKMTRKRLTRPKGNGSLFTSVTRFSAAIPLCVLMLGGLSFVSFDKALAASGTSGGDATGTTDGTPLMGNLVLDNADTGNTVLTVGEGGNALVIRGGQGGSTTITGAPAATADIVFNGAVGGAGSSSAAGGNAGSYIWQRTTIPLTVNSITAGANSAGSGGGAAIVATTAGNGGASSGLTMDFGTQSLTLTGANTDAINLTAGLGGNAGTNAFAAGAVGGDPGAVGNISVSSNSITAESMEISTNGFDGGTGGNSAGANFIAGNGGTNANGGAVRISAAEDIVITGDVTINAYGGTGGDAGTGAGNAAGSGGAGGNGGNVLITARNLWIGGDLDLRNETGSEGITPGNAAPGYGLAGQGGAAGSIRLDAIVTAAHITGTVGQTYEFRGLGLDALQPRVSFTRDYTYPAGLPTPGSGVTVGTDTAIYNIGIMRVNGGGRALHADNLAKLNIGSFEFFLPGGVRAGDIILQVTSDGPSVSGPINLGGATVHVGVQGGSSHLQAGDTVVLINETSGVGIIGTLANSSSSGQGMQGISLLYDFDLSTTVNQLLATVASGGPTVNPQTKALSEGRAGGMAFVGQGADMAAGQGMTSALAATGGMAAAGAPAALAGFGAISGGSSRYNTGSHVDVDGASLMTGLAWRTPLPSGALLVGTFFEAGWGTYDSYNSFSSAASVKGNGDTDYYGAGLLGRYDFVGGFYTEASVRAGRVSTDFASRTLGGQAVSYDSSSTYYGAHAGLGYIWRVVEKASLDVFTKYLWTHQNSDSVVVAGDPIAFKASDSQRWRGGARFAYAASERFSPYVGAAYEYEFDGEAKATAYGRAIDAPSLKGGTGIGELGIRFKPAPTSGLAIDFGVQGYVGMREGVTGSLQVKYTF